MFSFFFFSSRRRHTRSDRDWSSDVCSSDLIVFALVGAPAALRYYRGGVGLVIGLSVAVFTVYYVGLIGGENLGDRLIVGPFVSMWLPNLICAAVGAIGVWRIRKPGNTR